MSSQVYWVSLATVISVHAPSNPTTTKTDMPAPTIRTILLRVCRWGSRITWRASVEIVSSTVTCVCTITWHSPTMVKPASSVHSGKSVTCKKLMVGLKEQKQHLSGYVDCPFGRVYNYVDATKHQCYIQVAKSPKQEKEEKCQKWKKHKHPARQRAAAVLATLRTNELVDAVDAFSEDDHEEKPPFHLFFDIEAIHTGRHDPNLLIAEAKYDHPFCFKGEITLYTRLVHGHCSQLPGVWQLLHCGWIPLSALDHQATTEWCQNVASDIW